MGTKHRNLGSKFDKLIGRNILHNLLHKLNNIINDTIFMRMLNVTCAYLGGCVQIIVIITFFQATSHLHYIGSLAFITFVTG